MSSKPRLAYFHRARFRLTLYYTGIQLVFFAALGIFLYYRNSRNQLQEFRKFLKDETYDLMVYVYNHPNDWPRIQGRFDLESRGERYYDLSFRLLDNNRKVLASSRTFREEFPEAVSRQMMEATDAESRSDGPIQLPGHPSSHYLMTRPFGDTETGEVRYIVQTLAYLAPLDKLSVRFQHNIFSAIPAFVLISWFGGYALARKVLKPVYQIARTAREITSERLHERLPRSNSGDEFDMLAETLNDMIHRLEESFALLRQFAADAAHELRTPLTIMKGEAEIALRSQTDDPESYRVALESTIRECDRMIGIITSLLLLSQADRGVAQMGHESLRLDELLAEVAETFQILTEVAGITLDVAHFPEVVVTGDRSRLHELFANLLDNAVKYTPKGGTVSISCALSTDQVAVAIADSGVGIPEDEQEKIFDRFYRVDRSRSRETGGSGLGLSIVRWIAAAHGGRIHLHSAQGAGSTFTVVLPLAGALAAQEGAGAPYPPNGGTAGA